MFEGLNGFLVTVHCLQKKEKSHKHTDFPLMTLVIYFLLKLPVFAGHCRTKGATWEQGLTRRGAAWTQGFCTHSEKCCQIATGMSWWIYAVLFLRETKGCQERSEPRERGGLEIPGLKSVKAHISTSSIQILQMSQSHESVLRVILEHRDCPVCPACLVRTEPLGKRWVQARSLQYPVAKCNNMDLHVWLFRVKQALQVPGGWRGYLELVSRVKR